MTTRYGDIKDDFGTGGSNMAPSGATGNPVLRDVVRAALGAQSASYADDAALTASKAADRVDGQLAVTLDDYSIWVWKAADATVADGTHIQPTDVGAGAGRWVEKVALPIPESGMAKGGLPERGLAFSRFRAMSRAWTTSTRSPCSSS